MNPGLATGITFNLLTVTGGGGTAAAGTVAGGGEQPT